MLTLLCMPRRRKAWDLAKNRSGVRDAHVQDLQKNVLGIELSIPAHGKLCVEVPKGMLTLAVRKWPAHTCEVADVGDFKISMQSDGLQNPSTPGQASLTITHHDSAEQTSLPLCTLVMNEWHAVALPLVKGVQVSKILTAAEHVWKKQCVLYETSCIGSLQLPQLPKSLSALSALCLSPATPHKAHPQHIESFALPHKFRTLLQYNCKLVSLLQQACCDHQLSRSRGMVVNAGIAWNSTVTNNQWSEMILAETLEVVPLVGELPRPEDRICTRLSVKSTTGVHKIPVYSATKEALDIITHSIGNLSDAHKGLFYLFSKQGTPVVLTSIPDRKAIESAFANLQDARSPCRANSLQAISHTSDAKQVLFVLHAAREIAKRQLHDTNRELKEFTCQWLKQAVSHMPESRHLFRQGASLHTCDCMAALLCVAEDFSAVVS